MLRMLSALTAARALTRAQCTVSRCGRPFATAAGIDSRFGQSLETHRVENQPPPLENYNAFDNDVLLRQILRQEGADWAIESVRDLGRIVGSDKIIEMGTAVNKHGPVLKTHDRYGNRIDEVDFHPSYHALQSMAVSHGVHSYAWNNEDKPGAHVARAMKLFLFSQAESGIGCPLSMTYAAVPAIRNEPSVAMEWEKRFTSTEYDARVAPAKLKTGSQCGMAMTEKQGGSDVRANTTTATPLPGSTKNEYTLLGHKWFCSAPMCDAFLTLAKIPGTNAPTCFIVPRWRPDDTRNAMNIMRLKDKLGNKSNASSEIEYRNAYAVRVGPEGRGIPTIIDMVMHTRLDCCIGASALMRVSLLHAIHHTSNRKAFGKVIRQQPLMANVLADLAVESEAATLMTMRLARSFGMGQSEGERAFSRIATAVSKYWICKRVVGHVHEAMECHGGNGYVEDGVLARAFREAPLNGIWEGSGNVITLDVLRAMKTEPESVGAFFSELSHCRGADKRLDAAVDALKETVSRPFEEIASRRVVEQMALCLQGSLLAQNSPKEVLNAFLSSRLGDGGYVYGTLSADAARGAQKIIDRAVGWTA
eukprot:Opistho-2@43060